MYVKPSDIIHIEARNNNCLVHLTIKPTVIAISSNISAVEKVLPSELFVRIHRSYIINVLHVKKTNKQRTRVYYAEDKTLPISEGNINNLLERLKINLR